MGIKLIVITVIQKFNGYYFCKILQVAALPFHTKQRPSFFKKRNKVTKFNSMLKRKHQYDAFF